MFENKRIYKVITPIERNGAKYWMRLGSAFTNADNSINLYIDAVPVTPSPKGGLALQIRELTAEELRENAQKREMRETRDMRAAGEARTAGAQGAAGSGAVDYSGMAHGGAPSSASDVPF